MTPKLSVDHLSKTYPKSNWKILDDISFTVNNGEFVSIIGPSGCGKSTFFTILAGIEKETQGTIVLNGTPTTKRAGKFGFMPQSPLLLPWRTVVENVMLGLDILHIPKEEAKEKAHTLLKQFGLSDYTHAYPFMLSGGMQQRIALLRTVLFHQDFLLLDEPFGALDALTRLSCQLWLLTVWGQLKTTILFITHDIREAILLSDTIYLLSPRPATVRKKFSVDIERPRTPKHLASPKAIQLEQQIMSYILNTQKI